MAARRALRDGICTVAESARLYRGRNCRRLGWAPFLPATVFGLDLAELAPAALTLGDIDGVHSAPPQDDGDLMDECYRRGHRASTGVSRANPIK